MLIMPFKGKRLLNEKFFVIESAVLFVFCTCVCTSAKIFFKTLLPYFLGVSTDYCVYSDILTRHLI